jgi:hypothetical protein
MAALWRVDHDQHGEIVTGGVVGECEVMCVNCVVAAPQRKFSWPPAS